MKVHQMKSGKELKMESFVKAGASEFFVVKTLLNPAPRLAATESPPLQRYSAETHLMKNSNNKGSKFPRSQIRYFYSVYVW
jgi:hypothetical protein